MPGRAHSLRRTHVYHEALLDLLRQAPPVSFILCPGVHRCLDPLRKELTIVVLCLVPNHRRYMSIFLTLRHRQKGIFMLEGYVPKHAPLPLTYITWLAENSKICFLKVCFLVLVVRMSMRQVCAHECGCLWGLGLYMVVNGLRYVLGTELRIFCKIYKCL